MIIHEDSVTIGNEFLKYIKAYIQRNPNLVLLGFGDPANFESGNLETYLIIFMQEGFTGDEQAARLCANPMGLYFYDPEDPTVNKEILNEKTFLINSQLRDLIEPPTVKRTLLL